MKSEHLGIWTELQEIWIFCLWIFPQELIWYEGFVDCTPSFVASKTLQCKRSEDWNLDVIARIWVLLLLDFAMNPKFAYFVPLGYPLPQYCPLGFPLPQYCPLGFPLPQYCALGISFAPILPPGISQNQPNSTYFQGWISHQAFIFSKMLNFLFLPPDFPLPLILTKFCPQIFLCP